MPVKEIANIPVEVNDEGFMTNPEQWTRDVAIGLAKEENIELTDDHWKVINFIRKDYSEKGKPPSIRRIKKVGGIPTKDMYTLFPDGPAKKAAKISGLGKPEGCV